MFPLILIAVPVLLVLAQAGVMAAARKVSGAGRSMPAASTSSCTPTST